MNDEKKTKSGTNSELKKAIKIGVIYTIIASIVVIVVLKLFVFGIHSNTSGFTDYRGPAVGLNCQSSSTENGVTTTIYSDFLYNYQKTYKLAVYNRMIINYQTAISDDEYSRIISELNNLDCTNSDDDICVSNRLNLNLSNFGWSSKIDKENNRIIISFYDYYGSGLKITKTDKENIRRLYENNGYICE